MDNQNMYDRQRWCCEQCKRGCRGTYHVVKAGDTLYSISRMHNVPVAEIMRANPYINVYNLRINDQICIPNMSAMQQQQPPLQSVGRQMPYPEMPDDYFEMNGGMNAGMNNNMMNNNMMSGAGNVNGAGMSGQMPKSRVSLNENDTVGELLNKTGMTLEWLVEHINSGMVPEN